MVGNPRFTSSPVAGDWGSTAAGAFGRFAADAAHTLSPIGGGGRSVEDVTIASVSGADFDGIQAGPSVWVRSTNNTLGVVPADFLTAMNDSVVNGTVFPVSKRIVANDIAFKTA